MPRLIDLTGKRFGRLTVVSRAENNKRGEVQWLCKCDCGNETITRGNSLTMGRVKSCGCYARENHIKITHGKSKTPLHKTWINIKQRTENHNSPDYHHYGGRGITMCDEWKASFQSFYDWAMRNGYKTGLTIDRIDNNSGYRPDNCRWVSRKLQTNNCRRNILITLNGETKTLSQWAELYNINDRTVSYRLRRGWDEKAALTTPTKK